MNPCKRRILSATLALALAGLAIPAAHANNFPTKTVRIVVPYSAGGPVDSMARALAAALSTVWGQQVVVDNKPGANEVIGATNVVTTGADGHTLMLATDPTLSLNPYLFKKLSYDPFKDLAPVTRVAVSNMAFAIPSTLPVSTMKEFVAYAQANPGKVSYGSSGVGNGTHLSMAWFAKEAKIDMTHVPYKGLAPTLQDMMAGQVQAAVGAVSVIGPLANSGKLKVIGISGGKRAAALPNVPTFAQAGFPSMDASFYFGLIAPSSIPLETRRKIAADVRKIVQEPKFRQDFLDSFALEPVLDTPEEFAQFLEKDREAAKTKITLSGASLD